MTFSPLVVRTYPMIEPNYSPRPGPITRLIVHYTTGGTEDYLIDLFRQSKKHGREASVTYLLNRAGHLIGLVPEEYRPWTSGGMAADGPAVTVETMTFPESGQAATPEQMETLARLAADLSDRYGWGALTRDNVRGHREFSSTDCPGPWIWPRMDQIITRANAIRTEETPMPIAENGWPCIPLSSTATFLAPNGKVVYVRDADMATILGYVAWRWHMSVEPIAAATNLEGDPAVRQGAIVAIHSWRPAAQIAGSTYYSNHGTGMAMDVNGHLHPYEHSVLAAGGRYDDGFTDAQVAALRKIKAEIRALAGGVDILRLGLDFTVGRRDGMHVELWATAAQLARCAAAIRATGWLVPTRRGDIASYQAALGVTTDDFHGVNTTRVLKLEQAKLGVEPTGRWDVATRTAWCQTRLKAHGFDPGVVDGLPGPLFDAELKRFQAAKGLEDDGIPGRLTVAALAKTPAPVEPPPVKVEPTPKPVPTPAPAPTLPPGSRIAGADRYATSAAAYRAAPSELQRTVYLAAGNAVTLADALSAPSDGSVLLVRAGQSTLPTPVEAALRDLRPTRVVALGSPDVIPDATVRAALTAAGLTTTTTK